MELRLNRVPRWSKKHLDFLNLHIDAYGIRILEEDYISELNNINRGIATLRCTERQRCYEIYDKEAYIGDIVLDEENEISIIIFDEYSGRGYAYKAISLLIQEEKIDYLEAVVMESNRNENIKKLLHKLHFVNDKDNRNTWIFKR